ncbi:MAG: polysaccharide pyruvyl transferase family protein [Clostridia bacterium]|nr:polysaccharide pyruvyl transferase family protein [Clostridia bacterium]
MNIYIYNCPNTLNYGSMMMGENFINYYNKVSKKKNKYFVETTDEINIKRLVKATGVEQIYPVPMKSLFKVGIKKHDYLLAFFRKKNIISDFIKKIDLVVVLGGDDFTEDYGWQSPIINAIKFYLLQREGIKIIMFGQTMGPYRFFRKPVMKRLLKKIDKIYPRDPLTYQYLHSLGLQNIKMTDDLALLPLTRQEEKERTKEYISFCPSELIYRYTKDGNRKDWLNFNLFMIDKVMEKYKDKKVVLLAHVLRPVDVDDRIMVNELYNLIKDKYKDRIICENKEMYPFEVRNYIQQSLFTIASRMHPVISSIQCEIPAIALSYSTKYWGIIGERYDLEDYIIDVRYLDYQEMKAKFLYLINKIDLEYEEIQIKMREKNKLAEENILNTLNEIARLEVANEEVSNI